MNEVYIEKAGNRILVGSEGQVTGLDSSIPGAYRRKNGLWTVPLEFESCLLLRERYGRRLVIGSALTDWARAEKAKRSSMRETAGSLDAELLRIPDVAPVLAEAMGSRKYQRVAARYIADTRGRDERRRALIADTVGLGKTAESLAGVLETGIPGPYLIVCPKTAVNSTWRSEVWRWLPDDEVITLPETDSYRGRVKTTARQRRDNILNSLAGRANNWTNEEYGQGLESLARTWVIVHPYSIRTQTWWTCALCGSKTRYTTRPTPELDCGHQKERKTAVEHEHEFPQLFDVSWGAVIIDESHQILIMKTGTPNLQRRGAELLREIVPPEGVRLALSGTPFRSKPHQIWSTLNWLDPVRWSGKWRWIAKYWETSSGTFGGTTIGAFRLDREQMFYDELSDVMLRRERTQVRDDLPARIYAGTPLYGMDGPVGVWLEMTPKQAKAYRQMAKTATASLEGGDVTAIGVLAEMTRLKQFAGSEGQVIGGEFFPKADGNKYQWLVGFLEELGFPDRPASKVVVVSQFTRMLKAFGAGIEAEKLGIKVGYITGEESQRRRDENVAAFEDPDSGLDVLFLNTIAGGASITLDEADVMVGLDETWVDDDREQAEGRIDNRNPERKIVPRTYYYLRSLETIEVSIAEANAEARATGKQVLDGTNALALARKVLSNEDRIPFLGGSDRKIRRCRLCGVYRNQWHVGDCAWDGD